MGLISPTLPTINEPRGDGEIDILNALSAVINAINGNLDANNLAALAVTPSRLLGHAGIVSSLPGSPVDGQECFYLADATNGVVWALKYRAASASPYKWEVVGGNPLTAQVTGTDSFTTATFAAAVTNPGPTVTAPLAGEYAISFGGFVTLPVSGSKDAEMGPKIGATNPTNFDMAARFTISTAASEGSASVWRRLPPRTVSAAATVITMVYRSISTLTASFSQRELVVMPRRVG